MIEIITITKNDFTGFQRTINSSKKLREDSNVNQIVIDGSDQKISAKIIEIIKKEKNISYFLQKPSGISSAFNYGISLSKSEWLWFLNGGDEINHEIDLNSFLYIINKSSADAIIYQLKFMQTGEVLEHPELWSLWPPILSWIPHPTTIVRKKLFDIYGRFDEKLKIAMDYEIWLRFFSKKVKVDIISIPLVIFDQNGVALSQNKNTKKEVEQIIRKYFWQILKKWFWQFRMIIKAFMINSLFYKKNIN